MTLKVKWKYRTEEIGTNGSNTKDMLEERWVKTMPILQKKQYKNDTVKFYKTKYYFQIHPISAQINVKKCLIFRLVKKLIIFNLFF